MARYVSDDWMTFNYAHITSGVFFRVYYTTHTLVYTIEGQLYIVFVHSLI